MTAKRKALPRSAVKSFRLSPEDLALIEKLRRALGIRSVTDLIRQALRALAKKEGIE